MMEREMSELDLTKILDWAERKQKESKTFSSKPKTTTNVVELLQKEMRRSAELEAFFKDLDKLRKKEEKKEGLMSKMTTTQLTTVMVVTIPVYIILLMKLLT